MRRLPAGFPLHSLRLALTAAGLLLASCTHYADVKFRKPGYRPVTAAGQKIARTLADGPGRPPQAVGNDLDAAGESFMALRKKPSDAKAREDYNFAVSRIFGVIHDAKLKPWNAETGFPGGEGGSWTLSLERDSRPGRNPENYDLLPSDELEFKGTYVTTRSIKEGIGAPLIATSNEDFKALDEDRFAQGKHVYYGMTGVIRFEGRRAVVSLVDPLETETVRVGGHPYPLAADFTAPLALALARENPKKLELARLLKPGKYAETARLARLQPYDPKKIPVVCVHGLKDVPATWVPLINSLRADPEIRERFQFWFYSYPSGYPYPYSASILRKQLDEIGERYPDHKKIVMIGHSMGGMITRTMLTDTGMTLWDKTFNRPPEKISLDAETRQLARDFLIFEHRKDVGRAIFIAAPLRGAPLAVNPLARWAAKLVKAPATFLKVGSQIKSAVTLDPVAMKLKRMPNSVDTLAPDNRFVLEINKLPLAPGIPYHTIMGDRGRGDAPDSSDGLVPYWSSHMDGAQSELIVPSGHSAQQNPQTFDEVRRILKLHAKTN